MQQVKTLIGAGYVVTVEGEEIKVKRPANRLPVGLETLLFQAIKASKTAALAYLALTPAPTTTPSTPRPLTRVNTTISELEAAIKSGDLPERDEAWLVTQWQIVQAERGVVPALGSDGLSHKAWAEELAKHG